MVIRQSIYRQIVAVVFLLLYLFIASPVQLWHHHTAAGPNTGKLKFSKTVANKNVQSETCKICQHTYAPHVADYTVFNVSIPPSKVYKNFFHTDSYLSAFISILSNKGPPAI